jgi:hypothetical protein
MAGESVFSPRQQLVEALPDMLSAVNPYAGPDMTQGEFVRSLKLGGLISEPLDPVDAPTFYVPSSPYYWYFLVPAAQKDPEELEKIAAAEGVSVEDAAFRELSDLEIVSFGISGMPTHGASDEEAFNREEHFIDDEVLEQVKTMTPDELRGCNPLIDDIALRVSMARRPFFAGIERRYPLNPDGPYSSGWSQLIYSSWLTHAIDMIWKDTGNPNYLHIPRQIWEPGISGAEDKRRAARTLALAALAQTIFREEE